MSKKLLLADDSVTIQKVAGLIFANEDYDLACVSDGDAAFETICLERPDVVLADVNMPGKNGFELCSAIKNDPALSGLPVLLLVGSFEPFDEGQARSAGADGWIIKPFESQSLIDEVEGLLARAAAIPVPESDDAGSTGSDVWADLEFDNLDLEQEGDTEDLAATFGEPEASGAGLEPENLRGEDPLPAEEPPFDSGSFLQADAEQPEDLEETIFSAPPQSDRAPQSEDAPASCEAGLEEEEDEILFIDESDLLEEEPEQFAAPAPEEPELPATEPETPAADDTAAEPTPEQPPEQPPEPVEWPATGAARPEAEASVLSEPEKNGLDFFRNDGLITRLGTPQPQPAPESPRPAVDPVDPVEAVDAVTPSEEKVVAQVQSLSDDDLARIVERVAGTVIERLAGSILEKIAWEVVPDLAEGLVKEEIRKITETSN